MAENIYHMVNDYYGLPFGRQADYGPIRCLISAGEVTEL